MGDQIQSEYNRFNFYYTLFIHSIFVFNFMKLYSVVPLTLIFVLQVKKGVAEEKVHCKKWIPHDFTWHSKSTVTDLHS